jgi:NDP-sugar pyrophosphorylase family protein
MKQDLYIIAAGKGSRMGGSLPKALVPINGTEPCLTTTLKQIGNKFLNVFLVVNTDIIEIWEKYLRTQVDYTEYPLDYARNVTLVPIKSGLGDGHAVMSALESVVAELGKTKSTPKFSDDIVVCWGDVFFPHAELIDELLSRPLKNGLFPVVREDNPYVTLITNSDMKCISADFSKYGENHPTGFHDQSIFRFNRNLLSQTLYTLHDAYWKNGRYMTPGGELSLLHTFHYLYNTESPASVYETDYPTLSFNTPEEVADIQKEINKKWQNNQSS